MNYITPRDSIKDQILREIILHEIPHKNFLQFPSSSLFYPFPQPLNLLIDASIDLLCIQSTLKA